MPDLCLTRYESISIAVQIVGMIVLTWYTYLTWRQKNALIESNKTNGKALVLGHRSWVNAKIKGSPVIGEGGMSIELFNVGGVPALEVIVRYILSLTDAPTPDEKLEQRPDMSLLSIGSVGVQDSYSFFPATEQEVVKLRGGYGVEMKGLWLHVVCLVSYDNGFGERCNIRCGWCFANKSQRPIRTFYQLS